MRSGKSGVRSYMVPPQSGSDIFLSLYHGIRRIGKKKFHKLGLYKQKKRCYNTLAFKKLCTGGSMDRASDSGSEGWGFESLPVYQEKGSFAAANDPFSMISVPSGNG